MSAYVGHRTLESASASLAVAPAETLRLGNWELQSLLVFRQVFAPRRTKTRVGAHPQKNQLSGTLSRPKTRRSSLSVADFADSASLLSNPPLARSTLALVAAAFISTQAGRGGAHAPMPHVSRLRPGHSPTPSPKLKTVPVAGEAVSVPSPCTKHQGPSCQWPAEPALDSAGVQHCSGFSRSASTLVSSMTRAADWRSTERRQSAVAVVLRSRTGHLKPAWGR